MQGERVHIDDPRGQIGFLEEGHLVLDEFPLRSDEQDAHLQTLTLRIGDLEVQLHVVHVERYVLFGLPADDFAGIRLLHSIHLDGLDDQVPATDRGHDISIVNALFDEERVDGLGNQTRIHDLTLDDRVGTQAVHNEPLDLGFVTRVIDDRDLDEAASHIKANRLLFPADAE